MSWIKKIVGKKETTDTPGDSSSAKDETVFYGDEQASPAEQTPSRSSMISELAGWESESSADLSGELLSAQQEKEDGPSNESISLDFDDDSNQIGQAPSSPAGGPLLPDLEFDSEPKLDTNFDKPPNSLANDLDDEDSFPDASPELDSHVAEDEHDTHPPFEKGGLIDQMANGFDLDLGDTDEPTSEFFPAQPRVDDLATAKFDSPAPTPDEPAAEQADLSITSQPALANAVDLNSTANGEDKFDQLSTAKLDQPPVTPAPNKAVEDSVDEFDATVITTAAVEPATAGGADYVTGWLVVVDGPGKGQSRPIRSGINAVGRSPDQAIPLYFGAKSDGEISRRDHARVIYDPRGNNFKLIHGESRNLTYLNDEAVLQITDLKPYDRIVMGKTTLLFIPLCGNIFRW